MAKKRKSRGRGARITQDELDAMLSLYGEGKSFLAISQKVGRHWQTVRKYTLRALKDRQGEELRRDALRAALSEHYRDLVGVLESVNQSLILPGNFSLNVTYNWRPPAPERRNRLLIEALRDSHAKDSELWPLWNSWNQERAAYDKAILGLQGKVKTEVAEPKECAQQTSVQVTEYFADFIFEQAVSISLGNPQFDTTLFSVRPSPDGQGQELWLGGSKLAPGKDLAAAASIVTSVLEEMGKWKEIKELGQIYAKLVDVKDRIAEEIEVLTLKRVFPGQCRLCPV